MHDDTTETLVLDFADFTATATGVAYVNFTAMDYVINGIVYTRSAATALTPSPTTDANTSAAFKPVLPGYGCVFVFGFTKAGAVACVQGELVPLMANTASYTAGDFTTIPEYPGLPNDFCPWGLYVIRVATDFTASGWLMGTNMMTNGTPAAAGTSFTPVYKNLAGKLPKLADIIS